MRRAAPGGPVKPGHDEKNGGRDGRKRAGGLV